MLLLQNAVQYGKERSAPGALRCKKASTIMFGFHGWELLIILVIVLLIFGARRLPELGSSLGQSYKMLQKGLNGANRSEKDGTQEGEQSNQTEVREESER